MSEQQAKGKNFTRRQFIGRAGKAGISIAAASAASYWLYDSAGPPRPGDVRDSLADITAAREALRYEPAVDMREGLAEYFEWARTEVVSE